MSERRCEECGCCGKCCQCEYGATEEGVPACRCEDEPAQSPAPSDTERKAKAFDWLEERREYPVRDGVDGTHILPLRWRDRGTLLEAIEAAMQSESAAQEPR